MSGVTTWVAQVEQVLARAHQLFADPPDTGAPTAQATSTTTSGAADQIHTNGTHNNAINSGQFATGYTGFTTAAAAPLNRLADDDAALSTVLDKAAAADRQGLANSAAVLSAASTDVATYGPSADTPAGERALIRALRDRVGHQQQILQTATDHAADLTAPLGALYHPEGVVPYEPPPEDPPPAGIICYIGTKDGDPAHICAGYDVAEIAYFDDNGTYIIEDAETGVVRLERPIGPQTDDPTSCWLPPGGTDRTMCGPGTTSWHYTTPDGTMITENLNPVTGKNEITFQTPLGPLLP